MGNPDYDLIIEAYRSMVESLQSVNASLSELVVAQQQTILKLQGIQWLPSKDNSIEDGGA